MLERIRERPFQILWSGAALLVVLFILVQWREGLGSKAGWRLPPELEGFEELTEPPFSQQELVQRAEHFIRSVGLEPHRFHSVWPRFFQKGFNTLRAEHSDERLKEFMSNGAPLVKWWGTFYRPKEKFERGEQLALAFDHQGKLIGFEGYRFDAEEVRSSPSEEWRQGALQKVAASLDLDAGQLVAVPRTAVLGSGFEKADAVWKLEDASLGRAQVIVTASKRQNFLNFGKGVFLSGELGSLSRAGRGYAFWGALFAAMPLAFVMGLARDREPRPISPVILRAALILGIAVACFMSGLQIMFLWKKQVWAAGIFAAGIVFFITMGVFVFRRREIAPLPEGSRWRPWLLIGAVPLAYFLMSLGCSGNPFTGCSNVCTLARYVCVPLAFFALILGKGDARFYLYALGMCALSLMPHCICDNFVNHHWMEMLGVSPMCYFYGFCVAIVSVSGLCGIATRLCLLASAGSAAMVAVFAAGHQLFGFPW